MLEGGAHAHNDTTACEVEGAAWEHAAFTGFFKCWDFSFRVRYCLIGHEKRGSELTIHSPLKYVTLTHSNHVVPCIVHRSVCPFRSAREKNASKDTL